MTDDAADEIERLSERVLAYKGQVEAGAAEIAALEARVAELETDPPPSTQKVDEGITKAMEIVGNMRQAEAGLFDAAHSGQRGEDRSTALYDAYHAIRKALSTNPGEQG